MDLLNISIKTFSRKSDYQPIQDISVISYGKSKGYTFQKLYNLLKDKGGPACMVAVTGDPEAVVGYIIFHLRGKRYEILDINVDESFREMRIGTQLLNRVMQGKAEVISYIPERITSAIYLFKNAGFSSKLILNKNFPGDHRTKPLWQLFGKDDGYLFTWKPE